MGVTRDYLDRHQLQQRIQSLIQDVLREQPDNPYKYMLEMLKKEKDPATAKQTQEPKPLVPRPPEQPKPETRPGAARHQVAVTAKPEVDTVESLGQDDLTSEAYKAARFSVVNLLRMPRCQQAAQLSLRKAVRETSAKSISGLVLNSVKEKIADGVARGSGQRDLARSAAEAEVVLTPEYNRALATWARHVAYRGAGHILGVARVRRDSEDDGGRRSSMPQPIVFLECQGGFSWGSSMGSKGSPGKVGGGSPGGSGAKGAGSPGAKK